MADEASVIHLQALCHVCATIWARKEAFYNVVVILICSIIEHLLRLFAIFIVLHLYCISLAHTLNTSALIHEALRPILHSLILRLVFRLHSSNLWFLFNSGRHVSLFQVLGLHWLKIQNHRLIKTQRSEAKQHTAASQFSYWWSRPKDQRTTVWLYSFMILKQHWSKLFRCCYLMTTCAHL